jgi:hypothetical protein
MDLKIIEKAVDSLEGFKGGIGITGGEPTLHPEFGTICELLQEKVPSYRCTLATSGYKWNEYKNLIKNTFKLGIYYNDHSDPVQKHQPILIGIDEAVDDKQLMWRLIDNCWVQDDWCASITPKGAFFCEVAGSLDQVLDGDGGYPVVKDWWDKKPEEFRDQVRRYCPKCGGALPLERPSDQEACDLVSRLNYERLASLGSPMVLEGKVQVFEEKLGREEIMQKLCGWCPWDSLSGSSRKRHLKVDEIFLIQNRMRQIRWAFHAAVGGVRGIQCLFRISRGEIKKRVRRSSGYYRK